MDIFRMTIACQTSRKKVLQFNSYCPDTQTLTGSISLPEPQKRSVTDVFCGTTQLNWSMYTVSQKKQDTKLPQMLTDFQNSFTGRLTGKFATNSYLNIPPHLKRVTTLPCEISMFKKSQCSRSNWSKLPCKTSPTQKTCFKIVIW